MYPTVRYQDSQSDTKRIIRELNRNVKTREEIQAMGLGRCNIVCMRKAGNKDINQSKYVAKTS